MIVTNNLSNISILIITFLKDSKPQINKYFLSLFLKFVKKFKPKAGYSLFLLS